MYWRRHFTGTRDIGQRWVKWPAVAVIHTDTAHADTPAAPHADGNKSHTDTPEVFHADAPPVDTSEGGAPGRGRL